MFFRGKHLVKRGEMVKIQKDLIQNMICAGKL